MKHSLLRKGTAMIELIFALVVMGLVLMSAPMLISTATKSSFITIQQEAINEASTHANIVMGYHWDEGSADESFLDPILDVNAGNTDLNFYKQNGWRIGTPKESSRSIIREDGTKNIPATAPVNLGLDIAEAKGSEDDVDDFIGNYGLTLVGNATTNDYVEKAGDITITTNVTYINDSPNAGTGDYKTTGADHKIEFNDFTPIAIGSTNIKYITVTLNDNSGVEELNKTVILHAFVCNIGGYKLFKKAF